MQEDRTQKTWPGRAFPGLLAAAILAASYAIPILGAFLIPLLPAPLAYARLRWGRANFLAASLVCLALVAGAGGFPVMLAFAGGLIISAYSLGGSIGRGEPDDVSVLKGTLLPLLTVAPILGLYFLYAGTDPWAMLARSMGMGMKESVTVYRRMGMSQADIASVMPSLRLFARMVVDYLPAVAVSFMAVTSFVSLWLVKRHAARLNLLPGTGTAMSRWTAPDHAVWGVIASGFLMIPPVPVLRQAAGNLLAVFALVYLFQGAAVVAYLFARFRLPALLKALGALLIAIQPYLLLGMWLAGLFDNWADFRKVRSKIKK